MNNNIQSSISHKTDKLEYLSTEALRPSTNQPSMLIRIWNGGDLRIFVYMCFTEFVIKHSSRPAVSFYWSWIRFRIRRHNNVLDLFFNLFTIVLLLFVFYTCFSQILMWSQILSGHRSIQRNPTGMCLPMVQFTRVCLITVKSNYSR